MKNLKSGPSYYAAILLAACFMNTCGCASQQLYAPGPKPQGLPSGTYHRVEKGQTLWRISKIYNIDLDELAKINRIQDAAILETGQLIFIPGRQRQAYTKIKKYPDEEFSWPLKGEIICGFGQTFNDMVNKGINIRASLNNAITASRGGKVVFCDNDFKNFGRTIIIDHNDGFSTVYSGSLQLLAKTGDRVEKNSFIAKIDPQAKSRDKYLHFEIRKRGLAQNPAFYLSR